MNEDIILQYILFRRQKEEKNNKSKICENIRGGYYNAEYDDNCRVSEECLDPAVRNILIHLCIDFVDLKPILT